MLNRLQDYPPPANVVPVKLLTPVAKVAEKPQYIIPVGPPTDEVALRAYYIFINQGSHHGFDLEHWLEAEAQLATEHHAATKKSRQVSSLAAVLAKQ